MKIPTYATPDQAAKMNKGLKISQYQKPSKGGTLTSPDYSEWNKNIRNGTPEKNLQVPSYKKGGKVKKTGLAMVHKGEIIIPTDKVAQYHNRPDSFWKKATGGRM